MACVKGGRDGGLKMGHGIFGPVSSQSVFFSVACKSLLRIKSNLDISFTK